MKINKFSPFAIVGFILSIVSFLFCNFAFYTVFLVTIPALIFSIIGMKDKRYLRKGLAIAGLVISIVSAQIGIFAPPFIAKVNKVKQEIALEKMVEEQRAFNESLDE